MNKYFGVNLAGAEFDGGNPAQNVPGVLDKNYTYPVNLAEHQYYVKKGLTLFRIPLRWERIQRTLLGALSTDDITQIKTALDTAQQAGAKVILDLHNYGQYQTGANGSTPILTPVTIANKENLIDVWQKLVTELKDHPAIFGYELMNEPHDLPDQAAGWVTICQAVADAIGAIDTKNFILIPGYDWQSADRWPQSNANLLIKGKNILYSAHQYFDGDASGNYWWGDVTTASGSGRLQHFITWLATNNVQGIVTEYGVPWGATALNNGGKLPHTTEWYLVLDDFLTAIKNADVLIGGTAWAGGPWWGEYVLTIEPHDVPTGFTQERESMAIYQKYSSTEVTTPIPSPSPTSSPAPNPPVPTPTPSQPPLNVEELNSLINDASVVFKKIRAVFNV